MPAVNAEIITTGNEVLTGRIIDTNAAYLSRRLVEIGVAPVFRTTVGDERERYLEAVRTAMERAKLVIVTGGLGPTDDDLTREVCAEALSRRLVRDADAEKHVRAILEKYRIRFKEAELRQTFFPEGARTVPNRNGTAYGFAVLHEGRVLAALSGVPSELEQMAEEHLFPYISEVFPGLEMPVTRLLRVFGISESRLQEIVGPVFREHPGITYGITASQMVLTVSMTSPPEHENGVIAARQAIISELGDKLFSDGGLTLQETVASLLLERKMTVALAESCTGGLVSHLLTEVPGVSEVLLESAVTYSNESKVNRLGVKQETLAQHGAVSEQVAREMAEGVRRTSGADLGVGITGIAGPAGATPEKPVGLVHIAVASANETWAREFHFTGTRSDIKLRAANTALNMLRITVLRRET